MTICVSPCHPSASLTRIFSLFFTSLAAVGAGLFGPAPGVPGAEPRWFAYRCPYGVFEAETLRQFAKLGVRVVQISPLNTLSSLGEPYSPFPPSWIGPGQYDFSPVDKYFESVLVAHPQAQIICGIDLNTPVWWPRLLGAMNRVDSFCELGRIAAHERWRKETSDYLRAFLRHTESRWGQVICAYTLFGGMTLEWQDQSLGQESPSKRAAWRRWAQAQGMPDPVDIPPMSLRERASRGFFRDPVDDILAIRYWRFSNWLIGDTILFFARSAQEVVKHRVPVGTFYGYLWEHAIPGRIPYEGHLDFERVWASGDLDFFMAPASYHDREVGGGGGYMLCVDSLRLAGKGYVHELDHRTPSARSVTVLGRPIPGHESGFADDRAAIAGLRREFAAALIRGHSLWWCNLFGHWYDSPVLLEAIGQMRQLWDEFAPVPAEPVAQVAVFADPESMYYVDGSSPLMAEFLFRQRAGLNRMGTPYEMYSLSDLARVDLSRFRLILFPNLFVVDEVRVRQLRQKVLRDGRTVVWVYAPGIIRDGRFEEANVEKLTGVPFGTPGVNVRLMDGWRSVYIAKPNLPASLLKTLAAEAGVHIYSATEEPLWANSHFVALHSQQGGLREIVLPKKAAQARELFSGATVAVNTDRIQLRVESPGTVLLYLEPDEGRNTNE
ncbi:MAG: hypothetical protein NZ899_13145 [Thermoguttaceae bacterium]|nr:hypothetical protein [Thermoguttaceae bacterium]MDW8079123.1 hypothetical protein [Thermoguttaceae bacterium]